MRWSSFKFACTTRQKKIGVTYETILSILLRDLVGHLGVLHPIDCHPRFDNEIIVHSNIVTIVKEELRLRLDILPSKESNANISPFTFTILV